MLRFEQFIKEGMASSKRVGITDIRKLKPLDFIELMHHFKNELKGKLKSDNISISLKVDGSPLRIGMVGQEFFIETGKSGVMKSDKQVSDAIANFTSTPKVLHMMNEFKQDKKMISYLQGVQKREGDFKIIGELLYVPKAVRDGDNLKFVAITYNRKKLGELATFISFSVVDSEGNQLKNSKKIIEGLNRTSNGHINYDDPSITVGDLDLTADISSFFDMLANYKDVAAVLASRKKVDKQVKEAVTEAVKEYQEKLAGKILSLVKDAKFGDEFEGIVAELSTGKKFKVQSTDFVWKKGKK